MADDYFAIVDAIREDAVERPPVRKLIVLSVDGQSWSFNATDETNENG